MNKILEYIKNDEIIYLIRTFAQNYSDKAEIYLVGGALRDYYLGNENFDKDLIIKNTVAKDFAKNLAKELDAIFVPLDEKNKIYRIIMQDKINYIDVAGVIGENLEDDLKRRDLTINSIAINLKTFEIIDINGGINDLKTKKIRGISEENFTEDPLRLLRIYRFQANLGFEVDDKLTQIVTKYANKIHNSAQERISYEFLKTFSGDFCVNALLEMDKTGLLKEILPITEELKTVPPNLHHHLDLFHHSIEIIKQLQEIYEKSSPKVQEHLQQTDFGGASRFTHLKLSGLLHDIGKPSTWTIEEETGKHRFIKHDDVGSKMAAKILRTSKFSKKQIDYITKMIKYHIYPSHVIAAPEMTDKIYMRFIRKMENEAIDVILLAMADRLSARGVEITDDVVNKNIGGLQKLLDYYLNIEDSLEPLPKLISGEEIMELLNIRPSKELGTIIKVLKEAQLSGDVSTKEDAIKFVLEMH